MFELLLTVQFVPDPTTWNGIPKGVIFSTFVSSFIFLLGFIGNRMYVKYTQRQDLNTLKKYFCHIVSSLDKPISEQVDAFNKFSSFLKSKASGELSLDSVSQFNITNLTNIKHSDLYAIFLGQRNFSDEAKALNFQLYQSSIPVFENILKTFPEEFKRFMDIHNKYFEQWKSGIIAIRKYNDQCLGEAVAKGTKKGEDLLLEEIVLLHNKWAQTQDFQNAIVAATVFIKPFKELCKKHLDDTRAVTFSHHVIDCKDAADNLNALFDFYAVTFDNLSIRLEEARARLKLSVQFLQT